MDHLEQQCLVGHAILTEIKQVRGISAYVIELANQFFSKYPDLYRHDDQEPDPYSGLVELYPQKEAVNGRAD